MADVAYDGRDLEAMSFAARYHQWVLAHFRPYLGTRVAEVGAGIGSFSALLLAEPIAALTAVEPSDMYAQLARTTAHDARVSAKQSFFADLAAENAFDSVMYVNVLEHIEDDEAELAHAFRALVPGGHLCVFVPALPALMSAHDRSIGHYRRYTKSELERKARAAGFEIVRSRYFDIAGIIPWYVLCTLLGRSPQGGAVGLYDRAVVPIMRIIESLIPPSVGKNVLFVGRKPDARILENSKTQ